MSGLRPLFPCRRIGWWDGDVARPTGRAACPMAVGCLAGRTVCLANFATVATVFSRCAGGAAGNCEQAGTNAIWYIRWTLVVRAIICVTRGRGSRYQHRWPWIRPWNIEKFRQGLLFFAGDRLRVTTLEHANGRLFATNLICQFRLRHPTLSAYRDNFCGKCSFLFCHVGYSILCVASKGII